MALQAETLYVCTPAGQLLRDNDPFGDAKAPRFFLGRTPQGNVWRVRHDLPPALVRRLATLAGAEPVCRDAAALSAPPALEAAARRALAAHAPLRDVWRGPAFAMLSDGIETGAPPPGTASEGRPPGTASGGRPSVARITGANAGRLGAAFADLEPHLERIDPCYAVLLPEDEGGEAVAVCFSSRLSAGAAEAGVETLEQWRRRGFARAVVAAWAATVRAGGRLPIYSASWENVASQGVARALGFTLFGDDFSIG